MTTFEQDDYVFGHCVPEHQASYSNERDRRSLVVEESTIRSHVQRILTKLDLRDRAVRHLRL